MLTKVLQIFDRMGLLRRARAHCDIPCGIYDTGPALIAAVSVVRLMDILRQPGSEDVVALANQRVRVVAEKEKQAEIVKHEIRVIWGDYFKPPMLERYPQIHGLAHAIMQVAGACKQDVHREDGEELVDLVNQFAEIFWETKGVATEHGLCPYEPKLRTVYPILTA